MNIYQGWDLDALQIEWEILSGQRILTTVDSPFDSLPEFEYFEEIEEYEDTCPFAKYDYKHSYSAKELALHILSIVKECGDFPIEWETQGFQLILPGTGEAENYQHYNYGH